MSAAFDQYEWAETGDNFLQNVTGDEMWVYGYDPECKQ